MTSQLGGHETMFAIDRLVGEISNPEQVVYSTGEHGADDFDGDTFPSPGHKITDVIATYIADDDIARLIIGGINGGSGVSVTDLSELYRAKVDEPQNAFDKFRGNAHNSGRGLSPIDARWTCIDLTRRSGLVLVSAFALATSVDRTHESALVYPSLIREMLQRRLVCNLNDRWTGMTEDTQNKVWPAIHQTSVANYIADIIASTTMPKSGELDSIPHVVQVL